MRRSKGTNRITKTLRKKEMKSNPQTTIGGSQLGDNEPKELEFGDLHNSSTITVALDQGADCSRAVLDASADSAMEAAPPNLMQHSNSSFNLKRCC